VAATDQRDEVAPFSSTGPASVDIAAPGTNVLAPWLSDERLVSEDFEQPLAGRWTTGGAAPGWQPVASGGGTALTAPAATLPDGTTRWARPNQQWTLASFDHRSACHLDLTLAMAPGPERLELEYSTAYDTTDVDAQTWDPLASLTSSDSGQVSIPFD